MANKIPASSCCLRLGLGLRFGVRYAAEFSHKSHRESKHSSRDYSDSEKEKDTSLKDRKGREVGGTRVLKDSASGEKRKHAAKSPESKDLNGQFVEESGASKRRKDRVSDGVNDRWTGGEEESQKSKDSKSRRGMRAVGRWSRSTEIRVERRGEELDWRGRRREKKEKLRL
ncbi:hypothetical protein CK203_089110 [Vitis vinifera]|uniref:Uncharacterized protein n=1 Tax=Vitis vinifera TaxID=29760 RepID=A0A438DEF3_VITVI|nr:hypothetical protein CK203_089110 [Vitis vinifera]